jgi:hypothetical protein
MKFILTILVSLITYGAYAQFIVPASECSTKNVRYINNKFGFTLCLPPAATTEALKSTKNKTDYLKDFIIIKGISALPYFVYPILFKSETDSLSVYKKFESEFFDRLGTDKILKKEVDYSKYKGPSDIATYPSYYRRYKVTMASGVETEIGFEYLHVGNNKFDALCFAYIAPGGEEGWSYSLHNSVLLLESIILKAK